MKMLQNHGVATRLGRPAERAERGVRAPGPPRRVSMVVTFRIEARRSFRRAIDSLRRGHLREAEGACRRAIRAAERADGPDHPDLATLRDMAAAIAQERGAYAEAEAEARRAVAVARRTSGPVLIRAL